MASAGQMSGNGQLSASLADSLERLRSLLDPCGDVIFRRFSLGSDPPEEAAAVYCSSVVDTRAISAAVLHSLMLDIRKTERGGAEEAEPLVCRLGSEVLPVSNPVRVQNLEEVIARILTGSVAILVDGCPGALVAAFPDPRLQRPITESKAEGAVRGPRDAFVEELDTNIGLLRRRLPIADFRVETRIIGRRTRTPVAVAYLAGLPKPGVVEEVRQRLQRIEIDGVLESGYLEELIEDHPFSPFPTIEHTERPDKVVASLLEGRVAILTGNTPYVLLVPVSFAQFLQAAEDYYERYFLANSVRLLRYMALVIALVLPSVWVAVTTYHHEMIPSALFVALAAHREGVPWPAVIEAMLMEVAFELLREAGIRLPRPVGQAVSIIGGLIIGEAAIRAKIASPGMIIVVAVTGIASFVIPAYNYAFALRMLRFPLMLLAATLGLHGVVIGLLMVFIHMLELRSFGVPYLAPLTPPTVGDWKDTLVRAPWWRMKRRPRMLSPGDAVRQSGGQKPGRDVDS